MYDPVVYFPRDEVDTTRLRLDAKTSFCPLKGHAEHCDLVVDDRMIEPDGCRSSSTRP